MNCRSWLFGYKWLFLWIFFRKSVVLFFDARKQLIMWSRTIKKSDIFDENHGDFDFSCNKIVQGIMHDASYDLSK